jgi:general secretion pathway protein K
MPEPAEDMDPEDDDDLRNPDFRFNGEPLTLSYPQPDSVQVRIFDHAGKINLRNLTEDGLEQILRKLLEEAASASGSEVDDDEIAELLAAWGDWLDEDDGIRNGGAEDDYYLELEPPYRPRQGPLESVDEILLIRGFDRVFADVNLNAAFTLYSDSELVAINTASREALSLLPGLDAEAIDAIQAYRREQDFTAFTELEDILTDDDLALVQPWIDFVTVSSAYTILVIPNVLLEVPEGDETDARQPVFGGFSRTVRVSDFNERPFVLRIDAFSRLPDLN